MEEANRYNNYEFISNFLIQATLTQREKEVGKEFSTWTGFGELDLKINEYNMLVRSDKIII